MPAVVQIVVAGEGRRAATPATSAPSRHGVGGPAQAVAAAWRYRRLRQKQATVNVLDRPGRQAARDAGLYVK